MAQGTPVFPDLGYAMSHNNMIPVGFSPSHYNPQQMSPQQYHPMAHTQQYTYSNSNPSTSPNSSPQSQVSTIYPPNTQYQFYQPPPSQAPAQEEAPRPEFKRRKTFPAAIQQQPPVKQGNRRIPRVIAAAAPKNSVQKQTGMNGGGALYNVNDPRMVKEFYGELERQKSRGEKEATVFGYVFDGDA